MIRVAITGTHSVGKTTLAHAIASALQARNRVVILPEAARELAAHRFKMNQDITEYGAIRYLLTYLERSRQIQADVVVSDRSALDLLAYLLANESKKIRPGVVALVREIVHIEAIRFDAYLYLPIETPLELDTIRPANIEYQHLVDRKVRELLAEYGVQWFSISGNREQRLDLSLRVLDGLHQ